MDIRLPLSTQGHGRTLGTSGTCSVELRVFSVALRVRKEVTQSSTEEAQRATEGKISVFTVSPCFKKENYKQIKYKQI
jgi:hypothetical protein